MRTVTQRIGAVLLALWAWISPYGADLRAQSSGGGAESPFELGGSARVLGMGGAAGALTGQGDGFFENPGILATIVDHEILMFHAPLLVDTAYDSLVYFHPIEKANTLVLGVAQLGTSGISETSNDVQPTSSFSSQELQGILGYGFEFLGGLDLGGSLKYERQQIAGYTGSGIGADIGAIFSLSQDPSDYHRIGLNNLDLGFSMSNLLKPQVFLDQAADSPARVLRASLGYLYCPPASKDRIWIVAEDEMPQGGATFVKAGAEYGWNQTLFARAGFDGLGPTFGAGIKLEGFELDYAFDEEDAGGMNRFSLSYGFEPYRDTTSDQRLSILKFVARSYTTDKDYDPAIRAWQEVLKESPDDAEAKGAIEQLKNERQQAVSDKLAEVKEAMDRGDVEKALPLLARILSLDSQNQEARHLLAKVNADKTLSTDYMKGVEAYSREDYAEAVDDLQLVYEMNPHYRDVDFLYHDAESRYLPLPSMSKDTTDLYAQGVNAYMSGNYAKAVEVWRKVLEREPHNYLVKRNLDEAERSLSDPDSHSVDGGDAP